MGLWPDSARRQAPDVRAGGRMSGRSWEAGCPGTGRMSGLAVAILRVLLLPLPDFRGDAGCPASAEAPDVRAGRRMSGLVAGCPAADVPAAPSSSVVASKLPSRMV